MRTHRTAAWPLAGFYAALVVYASLFPFSGWRDQGTAWWAFVTVPWPRYWTWFDLLTNVAGYVPLGFLLALAWMRSGRLKPAWLILAGSATLIGALSFAMEWLQQYLPSRVPSNVDWLANSCGGLAGAMLAWALERSGWIARWSRFRARWFVPDAAGVLALLALWPFALLFPVSVPLGLGQGLERLLQTWDQWAEGADWSGWLPVLEPVALSPFAVMLVTACGLLLPVLLCSSVMTNGWRRLLCVPVLALLGVCASGLSAALSYGPAHAWVWISPPVQAGIIVGCVLGVVVAALPARAPMVAALICGMIGLLLVNQAPSDPYFAQNLAAWEQGRFARFHGLAQWLGWAWPLMALSLVLTRLVRR